MFVYIFLAQVVCNPTRFRLVCLLSILNLVFTSTDSIVTFPLLNKNNQIE